MKFTSRNSRTNLSHTLANHPTQTTKRHITKINKATTNCWQTSVVKVTKQTSRNSRMNLSHTLARNETKQQTSILAERNFYYIKNSTYYIIQQIKRGIERNKVTRKQKKGNGKMKPDNLAKNGR